MANRSTRREFLQTCGAIVATTAVCAHSPHAAHGEVLDEFASDSSTAQYVRVSPRDPRYLELTDGTPYIPIGLNVIHPGGGVTTEQGLAQMEHWMKSLADNGGNYIRVWLSADFWDCERDRAGVFDEERAKRIDALLEMANRYGIRVKMTIEHFREIEPNDVRQKWAWKPIYHVSQGGTAQNMTDWLANDLSRQQFLKKLTWLQQRFGNQPAIFAWELWNEINAVRDGDYMSWTEVMLPELKQRFPMNMTLQSLGSFDSQWAVKPYERLCHLADNDIAQVHRYLDLGAQLEVCHGPVDVLAVDAIRTLQGMNPGRPIMLAESGAVEPQHTGPFKLYAKDQTGILLHDVLFAPFFVGAAGAGQCWHWDQYVDKNNLWRQFRGFSDVVAGIDPAAESFEPRMLAHPRLRVYVLQGKQTTLVWCRDSENTWKSELADGRTPDRLSDVTVSLADVISLQGRRIETYDPWTNVWAEAQADGNTVHLPTFSRSIVIRVK
jgi:hypothetical protein